MLERIAGAWERVHEALLALLVWVESFAHTPYGGWALAVIAFTESSFFPIPPDVLLIPLCLGQPERAFEFAAICAVASVVGGIFGYGIGFYGGRPLIRRWFAPERVRAVERYYDKYNAWATGIGGLTPLPYKLFTISGGAFAIDFKIFVLASIVARSARFFAVAGLIYLFGEPVREFVERYLDLLSIAFVVLLVLGFWFVGRRTRRVADDAEAAAAAPPTEGRDGEAA